MVSPYKIGKQSVERNNYIGEHYIVITSNVNVLDHNILIFIKYIIRIRINDSGKINVMCVPLMLFTMFSCSKYDE